MRIFVDCTHTANHPYKNTGIHRVVRQLVLELIAISEDRQSLEIIPVKFNGNSIHRVQSLKQNQSAQNLLVAKKNIGRLLLFPYKAINKLKKLLNHSIDTFTKESRITQKTFAKTEFSARDIYLMPDANWDLPKSYYSFLKHLKSYGVQVVLICHDLIPIKFPEFCSESFSRDFIEYYVQCSALCDKVIGVSRNSAEDYLAAKQNGIIFNNLTQIIESFRLGCDPLEDHSPNNKNIDHPLVESLLSKQYILVVGSLSPHKNAKAIIAAFDLLLKSNRDIYLVFAGNRGWHSETDLLIESNSMYKKLIYILSSTTDSQLQLLYKNCYCLVQASLYEGFGLPVVEALQHGKPVISSTAGSLAEVGGDFCIYFDPHQPLELYQALKKLLDSDTYYNQLVTRIKNEYKPFSWRESAEQLLSLM